MKHLMIEDLAMTEELGRKVMAAVRGGIVLSDPIDPGMTPPAGRSPNFPVPAVPFDWSHIRIDELLGLKPVFPIARVTLPHDMAA